MFLLSRRSAVFALFVILAFATSTLLALITEEERAEANKLCFGYGVDKWHEKVMFNSFGNWKTDLHTYSKFEFGLEETVKGKRCVVWETSLVWTSTSLVEKHFLAGGDYVSHIFRDGDGKETVDGLEAKKVEVVLSAPALGNNYKKLSCRFSKQRTMCACVCLILCVFLCVYSY
eukprot:GHVS01098639.1.p1 GENE.GHVS01098639.1~~GHVS01098639.1.p1  ORF type:complete len:194 (-),score=26.47 GHVS01098639.1:182-703(-)